MRQCLTELGHKQPATPIKTDNSTAHGIVTNTIKQKRSKAMDMRFYWLRDRTMQKQFHIYWEPGKHNLADLPTKHHPGSHHRRVRPIYVYDKETSPVSIQGCIKLLSPLREVETNTQERTINPNPQISYLCQLSQSQAGKTRARAAHTQQTHAEHSSTHSSTDRVQRIILHVLQNMKQLSSRDNILSSLY